MSDTQEDLGFLTDQRKILVLGLPSGTKSVVVNYDLDIKVSCIMPAAKRTIHLPNQGISEDKLTVKCPDLLFCSEYADIPMYGKDVGIVKDHSIFVYNSEEKNKIEACPYYISNVYGDGRICFGELLHPYSPKEAFNVFWESPFNSELRGEEENAGLDDYYDDDLDKYIKRYHKEGIHEQDWDDYTADICGSKFWASPAGAEGILISSCNRLLKKIPYKFWRRGQNGYPMVITLANRYPEHWEFTSGGFKFCLDKGFVTTNPKFSSEVSALKQRFSSNT